MGLSSMVKTLEPGDGGFRVPPGDPARHEAVPTRLLRNVLGEGVLSSHSGIPNVALLALQRGRGVESRSS